MRDTELGQCYMEHVGKFDDTEMTALSHVAHATSCIRLRNFKSKGSVVPRKDMRWTGCAVRTSFLLVRECATGWDLYRDSSSVMLEIRITLLTSDSRRAIREARMHLRITK